MWDEVVFSLILVLPSCFCYAQQFDYQQDVAEDDQHYDYYERNYVSDKGSNIVQKILSWLVIPFFLFIGWAFWQWISSEPKNNDKTCMNCGGAIWNGIESTHDCEPRLKWLEEQKEEERKRQRKEAEIVRKQWLAEEQRKLELIEEQRKEAEIKRNERIEPRKANNRLSIGLLGALVCFGVLLPPTVSVLYLFFFTDFFPVRLTSDFHPWID